MQALVLSLTLILTYGLLHSVLAARATKRLMRSLIGERAYLGLYRLFFNAVAAITILPVLAALAAFPGDAVWIVSEPWSLVLRVMQAIGLIGLLVAFLDIDGLRFLGFRQLAAWWNDDPLPLPPEQLQQRGTYQFVRHPLYLFSLLLIWPTPTMSMAWFGFCIGASVYFVVGSLLEEQKMVHQFGTTYEDYRRRVPWLIPFMGGRS